RRVARYLEQTIFKTTVPPEDCAAIIVEPIQGEGGYVVPDADFFPELRRICDAHGILLIVDEVQSGVGRTGKMWAIEHTGVVPDMICMAKAIGGGIPLGVLVTRADLMAWHVGAHASTFGGNPVAIVAALKTIELIEKGVMQNAREVGEHMMDRLRALQQKRAMITDVRGRGLMIGCEIARDLASTEPWPELRDKIVVECFNRGLVIQGAGESAIRFSPPLIIDREQADFAVETLDQSIAAA